MKELWNVEPLRFELVADTVDRADRVGIRLHLGQFLAQVLDVAVDGPVRHYPVVVVDMTRQLEDGNNRLKRLVANRH